MNLKLMEYYKKLNNEWCLIFCYYNALNHLDEDISHPKRRVYDHSIASHNDNEYFNEEQVKHS